ncbi:cysteine synthase A [Candidatus Xianfuyuplasma coldseepsis]|uniref:Cysteine synthase n=1 Tax=Candidatus Xianfuyuplasma coldseepsis TaxID=2782163 RepID=A0A7L7KQC9_9MOLU|nr:cysteine synthase A [Xianfuyuplasma coldseepsis]QMS85000.1 cysteine synthase A [Xianfuyuplasma coldseepsis]
MIVQNIYDLIGNTPIIELHGLTTENDATLYLKLEWFNPGGSVKDRIALNMIHMAEQEGLLTPGDTIVEPTSGNTGIGIAMVGAAKGYKTILIMPDSLSIERRKILKGYGATLILTEAEKGMKESIRIAEDLVEKHGYFMPMQFENINNPKAHMKTTALEILEDLPNLDYFVAAVGTGGTITGVGSILKEHIPHVSIKAVEPKTSAVLSGNPPGPHTIQGIGAGFIPDVLDTTVYDEVLLVDDDEAYEMARYLAKEYGLFVGISTGANVAAALQLAHKVGSGKTVLTVSPSNAERYLSTKLFIE